MADRLMQMSLDPDKRNASADRVEGMGKMLQVLKESRLSNLGKTSCLMDDISLAKTFRREPLISRGYGTKDFFLCTRPMKIQHWGIISILRMSVLHMKINIASAYTAMYSRQYADHRRKSGC